ncbi:MAG: four helix bundle protein [Candidatus Margulisiibacteriota bacterium]
MFDFENLNVYQKSRDIRKKIFTLLSDRSKADRFLVDQLKRAVISIILNIAEGTGKSSKADRRNFFVVARASVYEVVAVTDLLFDDGIISKEIKDDLYIDLETISKMLLGLINSLK